jgi:hypothetical protein
MPRCSLGCIGLALVLIGSAGPKGWQAVEVPEFRLWTCEHKGCITRCWNRTTQVQRVILNGGIWFFAPGSSITLSGPCSGTREP